MHSIAVTDSGDFYVWGDNDNDICFGKRTGAVSNGKVWLPTLVSLAQLTELNGYTAVDIVAGRQATFIVANVNKS